MSKEGAPAQQHRPDDGWWETVYEGPAGTLPDTPGAVPGEGSVDDWFETAAGLIGPQRTGGPAAGAEPAVRPEPVPESGPGPEPEAAERDSIDDWFDTAVGVIGQQRGPEETHKFQAPAWAATPGPAAVAEPEPEPEVAAEAVVVAVVVAVAEPEPAGPVPEPAPVLRKSPEPAAVSDPEPPAVPEAGAEPEPVSVSEPEPAAEVPDPAPAPAPAVVVARPATRPVPAGAGPAVPHVGERPPTYGPEPTAVPEADPGTLGAVVPDTVLEGAQYGAATLRAVSVRGDSARYRGEPRRDALLVTRFGEGTDGLLLAVLGGFDRSGAGASDTSDDVDVAAEAVATAAAEACRQLAAAVGRSRAGLAADLRDGARDRLRYGLQRLATAAAAPLRALTPRGAGDDPAPQASLHCLLLSLDPAASYRAAFGVGPGGLYLLRSGHWIDAYAARLLHHPDGQPPVLPESPVPDPRPFRFRMVPATPGDILLLCTPGLARPVSDEPAVAHFLAAHWAHLHPPGTVDFLRQVQVRARGYADDRTAAAIWTE
ncbi:protein phosphatase 2C domain-containing protein [Kitasatospora sp. NPDC091207]|uniref:protein phosphatase 2C domain-containing protein n=1 Tax=Kitasatospora sp. NPDC091207 TaxID=3364083 RepID=UPI0038181835